MKTHEFMLEEIVRFSTDPFAQNAYIKVRETSGVFIVFWGRPKDQLCLPKDMNNIDLIKSLSLPARIKIECDHDIEADKFWAKELSVKFSISEGTSVSTLDNVD